MFLFLFCFLLLLLSSLILLYHCLAVAVKIAAFIQLFLVGWHIAVLFCSGSMTQITSSGKTMRRCKDSSDWKTNKHSEETTKTQELFLHKFCYCCLAKIALKSLLLYHIFFCLEGILLCAVEPYFWNFIFKFSFGKIAMRFWLFILLSIFLLKPIRTHF